MDTRSGACLTIIFVLILESSFTIQGDLETIYARCCALGVNWARESQKCNLFPAPVPGQSSEHQSICITTASICCLRYYRETQCVNAKEAAKLGQECVTRTSEPGGEYFKDCCDGCKLGLISGSMAKNCAFRGFSFGYPWNDAYLDCCIHASPPGSTHNQTLLENNSLKNKAGSLTPSLHDDDKNFLFLSRVDGKVNIPDDENLCLSYPGQLCGHVCVPTHISYVCQCRAGFILSDVDKKTCIQEEIKDRCAVNPCDHICRDTGVSIECICRPGYQLRADKQSCDDVNECKAGLHHCISPDQVCYNQQGTYSCVNADGTLTSPVVAAWAQGSRARTENRNLNLANQNERIRGPNLAIGNQNIGFGNHNNFGIRNQNMRIGNQSFRHSSRSSLGAQGYSGNIKNAVTQGLCPPGYNYNLITRLCDDINECVVALGICGHGFACHNTIGSYSCNLLIKGDCPTGFQFDMNHQSCLDINECVIASHNCLTTEACVNIQGGFNCEAKTTNNPTDCPAGFKFNSEIEKCEDVDECFEGLHSCHLEDETCRNIIGAYECDIKCEDGFQYTNQPTPSCVDINECLIGYDICNRPNDVCINTVGSFRCQSLRQMQTPSRLPKRTQSTPLVQECLSGYGFDLTTGECLDINECNTRLHNCTSSTHYCINTLGSFLCRPKSKCSSGYKVDPLSKQCIDVNECKEGLSYCLPGQICVNTEGGFDCQVECRDGFIYEPNDPSICVDINECNNNPCHDNERCTNTEGSFACLQLTTQPSTPAPVTANRPTTKRPRPTKSPCPQGFKRKRRNSHCKDINECREHLDNCLKSTEECINLQGSYTCRPKPCSKGFYRNTKTKNCEDIDECSNLPCKPNEDCINRPGSFVCIVRPPCETGFKRDETINECQDINECIEEAPCETSTRCINTRGSYRCRTLDCTPGYQRNPLSGQCKDVDECKTGEHSCKVPGEECVNSPGTYRCKSLPPCPQGFKRDPSNFRCVDVDECAEGLSDCNEYEKCVNQYGRYKCRSVSRDCDRGYRYYSPRNKCEDIDECAEKLDNCAGGIQTCVNTVGSFRCIKKKLVCDFGYKFDIQLQSCQEIESNSNRTKPTSVKVDGFREEKIIPSNVTEIEQINRTTANRWRNVTTCQPGLLFRFRQGCVDINECVEGSHLCNEGREKCFNLLGGYRCDRIKNTTQDSLNTTKNNVEPPSPVCPAGLHYNSEFRSCIDINECDRNVCDRDTEDCINSQGSYNCQCKNGFTRNEISGECVDLNECQLEMHNCEALQRCDNTIGSYSCTRLSGCGTGYTLNYNTGICEDDDECLIGRNDCRQLGPKWVCINTKGSFKCDKKKCPPQQLLNSWGICVNITCTPGFRPFKTTCVDINECFEDEFPCKPNEHCLNRIGTFECRPKINCGRGYRMNDDGTQCIDVDECDEDSHTCEGGQSCTNRPGGYVCQCPQGHRLDVNRQCKDINECQTAYSNLCGNTGDCENTPGSFRCNCKKGFKKSFDGKTCIDVDECVEIEGICDHNCINIWSSHYCTCNAGYTLDADKRSCSDINECEEILGKGRLCLGICVNTPGTFKCSCPNGYSLESDQRTCKDINECDKMSVCHDPEEICVNTRGSHRCQKITCPPNYIIDDSHRNRCKKELKCRDDDIACIKEPQTYSYNFLPLASNLTLRPQGQVDLFTMRGPLWSNTVVQFELELENVNAQTNVSPAARNFFLLNRTAFNQVVLKLIKPLQGPQEIHLNLLMKLYHNGYYGGSSVAKLLIFVSEYDF